MVRTSFTGKSQPAHGAPTRAAVTPVIGEGIPRQASGVRPPSPVISKHSISSKTSLKQADSRMSSSNLSKIADAQLADHHNKAKRLLTKYIPAPSGNSKHAGILNAAESLSLAGTSGADKLPKNLTKEERQEIYRTLRNRYMTVLAVDSSTINTVAYSPLGSEVAVALGGKIELHSAANCSTRKFFKTSGFVLCLSYNEEGTALFSAGQDKTITSWKVDSLKTDSLYHLKGHQAGISCIDVGKDILVSGSLDQTVKVWDLKEKHQITSFKEHKGTLLSVALTPDCETVASSARDGSVRVWEARTGLQFHKIVGFSHSYDTNILSFSPDGSMLAAGSNDDAVRVWETSRYTIRHVIMEHKNEVTSVSFHPSGEMLVSGSQDKSIAMAELHTGTVIRRLVGHDSIVSTVAFSPDGMSVLSASGRAADETEPDNSVRIWDYTTLQQVSRYTGHKSGVHSCSVSINGEYVASASGNMEDEGGDNSVHIWKILGRSLTHRLEGHVEAISAVEFSPNNEFVCSGSLDCQVILWNVHSGEEVRRFLGHEEGINSLCFSPDGEQLISGADGNNSEDEFGIRVWNVSTGSEFAKLQGHESDVTSVAYNPKFKNFCSASEDKTIAVWDGETFRQLLKIEGHKRPVDCVSYSSDGKTIVSASIDKTIRLWHSMSGKELLRIETRDELFSSVTFSPDGKYLASGSLDRQVRVWDVTSGKALLTFHPHKDDVTAVVWTPDGNAIVSTSSDTDVVVTPTPAFSSYLAPSVHIDVLKPDLENAEENLSSFEWSNSSIGLLLERHPYSLIEKRWDDERGFTVVHVAAATGCSGFLDHFLKDTGVDSYELKRRNLAACLALDRKGHTALYHAMGSESGICVDLILGCMEIAFHPEFATKPSPDEFSVHWADLLPLSEILLALQKFPFITLRFIQKLKTFDAYETIVRIGCEKVDIDENNVVVLGSAQRCPPRFWQEQFYPVKNVDEEDIAEEDDVDESENIRPVIRQRSRRESMAVAMNKAVIQPLTKTVKGLTGAGKSRRKTRVPVGARGLLHTNEARRASFLDREHHHAVNFVESVEDVIAAQHGLPVTAKLVPLKNAAGIVTVTTLDEKRYSSSLLEAVVQATEVTGRYAAFENEVIKAIINFKWDSHVKQRFLLHCKMDIFMVLCFSADALLHAVFYHGSYSMVFYYLSWFPTVCTVILWLYFTRHEWQQFTAAQASTHEHIGFLENVFSDIWNALDFCSLGSIAITYLLRVLEHYNKNETTFSNSTVGFAFAVPLTFLNLLKYMQGFQVSGELVSMVIGIMKGIMTFTLILLILMVGFAIGFFILGQADIDSSGNVIDEDSWSVSFVKTYSLLLSNYVLDDFTMMKSSAPSIILFISFTFFVNIVLLNLLIAIMGELFDKIKENAKATFLFAKANLILEFESIMQANSGQATRFPEWLQILLPTRADDGGEDTWESRIRTLKLAISQSEAKQTNNLKVVEHRVQHISYELTGCTEDIKNDAKFDNAEIKQGMQNMKSDVLLLRKGQLSSKVSDVKLMKKVAGLTNDVDGIKHELAEIKGMLLMLTNGARPDPETVKKLEDEAKERVADQTGDDFDYDLDDDNLKTIEVKNRPNLKAIAATMRFSGLGMLRMNKKKNRRKKGKQKLKQAGLAVASLLGGGKKVFGGGGGAV
ncbi:hypothetical protein TrST_g4181 [Triparma strigata]|uniref:Ion transport domain-containing protein n=1 Tax=Triparma strigata TaxID=1606541 RepID=A0A9W7AGK8_9STRA|nr:hypothetical protein TrST_g4181 [Triparma strigata]